MTARILQFTALTLLAASCASQPKKSSAPRVKASCEVDSPADRKTLNKCLIEKKWAMLKLHAFEINKSESGRADGFYFLSQYHLAQGNLRAAEWMVKNSLKSRSTPAALYLHSVILIQNNKVVQAEKKLRHLIQTHEDFPQAHETLAKMAFKRGNCASSIEHWSKLNLAPDHENFRHYLFCLKHVGENSEFKRQVKAAMTDKETDPALKEWIKQLMVTPSKVAEVRNQ